MVLRFSRGPWITAALALLYGCGGAPVQKPAALTEFQPTAKLNILWQGSVGSAAKHVFFPRVSGGIVYAAGADGGVTGFEKASGRTAVAFDAEERISGGVGAGGELVLLGTPRGRVLAFDREGKPRWQAQLSSEVLAAPEAQEGIVVVRTGDGRIHGLDAATGKGRWIYQRTTPALTVRTHAGVVVLKGGVFAGFPGGRLMALALANGVRYGLAAYLWTNDVGRAHRFARALEAGMVWVNSENNRHLPTPFGGMKASGIGRDGGDYSFDFYMETFGRIIEQQKRLGLFDEGVADIKGINIRVAAEPNIINQDEITGACFQYIQGGYLPQRRLPFNESVGAEFQQQGGADAQFAQQDESSIFCGVNFCDLFISGESIGCDPLKIDGVARQCWKRGVGWKGCRGRCGGCGRLQCGCWRICRCSFAYACDGCFIGRSLRSGDVKRWSGGRVGCTGR